jgi:hypothetical protein
LSTLNAWTVFRPSLERCWKKVPFFQAAWSRHPGPNAARDAFVWWL